MSRKEKCWELCCSTRFLVFATLLVVGSLVVAFSVGGAKDQSDNKEASSTPPGSRQEAMLSKILSLGITSEADLKNADTAGYKALQFIAETDEAQLAPDDPSLMDRYAMCVLYQATQPKYQESPIYTSWIKEEKWMSKASICDWHGIDCERIQDQKDIVVHISLAGNQLQGTLPSELKVFKDLVQLDLSGNRLFGPIPEAIGDMSLLGFLMLQDNELTGKLPSSLGGLFNAEEIILSNNKLEGNLPEDIGHLTKLRSLKVDHNMLSGALPKEWKMTRISKYTEYLFKHFIVINRRLLNLFVDSLRLSNNEFKGHIPHSLFELTTLVDFRIGDNFLTGTIPPGKHRTVRATDALPLSSPSLACLARNPQKLNPSLNSVRVLLGSLVSKGALRRGKQTPHPGMCCWRRVEVFEAQMNQLHGDIPEVFDRLHHLRKSTSVRGRTID
jgi:hypothetical protein